jgi:hypothetical protein
MIVTTSYGTWVTHGDRCHVSARATFADYSGGGGEENHPEPATPHKHLLITQ